MTGSTSCTAVPNTFWKVRSGQARPCCQCKPIRGQHGRFGLRSVMRCASHVRRLWTGSGKHSSHPQSRLRKPPSFRPAGWERKLGVLAFLNPGSARCEPSHRLCRRCGSGPADCSIVDGPCRRPALDPVQTAERLRRRPRLCGVPGCRFDAGADGSPSRSTPPAAR